MYLTPEQQERVNLQARKLNHILDLGRPNVFYVKNLSERMRVNEFDSSTRSVDIQLEPNKLYTIYTTIPARPVNGLYDLFFHVPSVRPSSDTNGVRVNEPRSMTTDETGVVTVSFRPDHVSGIEAMNDNRLISLRKSPFAYDWSIAPEDKDIYELKEMNQ
jgi:hypothetical protein